VALLLSTAMVTAVGDPRRSNQYLRGLKKVLNRYEESPGLDIFWIDNTVANLAPLDSEFDMFSQRPNPPKAIFFEDNRSGLVNKGAGLLVQWHRWSSSEFGFYDFIVHYEPRLRVYSWKIFDSIVKNPRNLFMVEQSPQRAFWYNGPRYEPNFFTGFFCLDLESFSRFLVAFEPHILLEPEMAIEDAIHRFISDQQISFESQTFLGLMRMNGRRPEFR